MIKHVLVGVFAAFVAIVIVSVAQPKESPTVALGPPVVKIDDLETFLPEPENLRPAPATRPANPLDKIVKEAVFEAAPLNEVISFLRDVTDANIDVSWYALQSAGIEKTATVTMKLREVPASVVLSRALESATGGTVPLQFRFEHGIVRITTAEFLARETDIRLYNVRDLMIEAMRFHRSFDHAVKGALPTTPSQPADVVWTEEALSGSLRDLILECAARDSWVDQGGSTGFCHYWAGKFLIVQTPEAHEQIEHFLNMLREE